MARAQQELTRHVAETEGFEPSVPVRGLHLSRVREGEFVKSLMDTHIRVTEHFRAGVQVRDAFGGDHDPKRSTMCSSPATERGVAGSVKLNSCTSSSSFGRMISKRCWGHRELPIERS